MSALLDAAILAKFTGIQPISGGKLTLTAFRDIYGLRDKVEFHDASRYPFMSARIHQELAWGIGFLNQTRLATPTQVFLGGHYDPSGRGNLGVSDMELERYQNPSEVLAEFYMNKQPDLFGDFTNTRNRILIPMGGRISQPELTLAYGSSNQDDQTAFKLAFARYISDGAGFRRRILYAETKDLNPEAAVLQAQYDFLKRSLGPENSEGPLLKGIGAIKVGEYYSIYDFPGELDPEFRGIYLRPEPRPDINPHWPNVDEGDSVIVLSGPGMAISERKREAYKMFEVQAIFGRRGWVDQEYLKEPVSFRTAR